jgi:catechol 2,3-dioxygenase-like lactoylglutathione lyase family enzyme
MSIDLNHTIVPARDPRTSAKFLADILGLPVDPPLAHFTPVTLTNGVSLDYDQMNAFESHHYAFMLGNEEFDAAFARIQDDGITYYADPGCTKVGEVYHNASGNQGAYFRDPDGHLMEIITRVDISE